LGPASGRLDRAPASRAEALLAEALGGVDDRLDRRLGGGQEIAAAGLHCGAPAPLLLAPALLGDSLLASPQQVSAHRPGREGGGEDGDEDDGRHGGRAVDSRPPRTHRVSSFPALRRKIRRSMKGCARIVPLVALLALSACGGDGALATRPASPFDALRALRDLRAAVRLGPRPAGSAANRRDARLIAAKLRDAGVRDVRVQRPWR